MLAVKILYRKNLKMSTGKVAAQCSHAASRLTKMTDQITVKTVCLGVSNKKFEEARQNCIDNNLQYCTIRDAGRTEVESGSETVIGWVMDSINIESIFSTILGNSNEG